MKARTQGFKESIKTIGRELDVRVSYDNEVLDTEVINTFKPHFNTEFFKTIMKTFEFDSNVKVPAKTWVTAEFGVKVDDEYEYLNYGQYYINDDPEYSADNRAYTHKAYDAMIEAMIPFDENPLYVEYPISYDDLITNIINQLGWTYDLPADYPNKDTMIEYDLYSNLGLTYRDILDDLCPATMGNFLVTDERKLKIIYPTETGDTIDEEFLKDANVNVSKKVGPINSLVLSRAEEGDEIYRRDEESIDENNLNEIKIKDNLLLSSAFRENFIDEMFDRIKNFEYYSMDVASTGVAYYEPLDRFTMSIEDENYSVVLLNSELNIEGGVSENLFTPKLEESVTDYSTSAMTDKAKKMANIIAYKNQARIELMANQWDDLTNFIVSVESQGEYIKLDETMVSNGAINKLSIKNFSLQELYPHLIYPSNWLFPNKNNFYTIIFSDNEEFDNSKHVYINSPISLVSKRINGVMRYDEVLIEQNKVKIKQNINYNETSKRYELLDEPIIYELYTVILQTFEKETYIKVLNQSNLIYDVEYLKQNEFTNVFATQLESESQFIISADGISSKVSKNNIITEINQSAEKIQIIGNKVNIIANEQFQSVITGINNNLYNNYEELNSSITQTAGSIMTEVNKKVNTTTFNSTISQTESSIMTEVNKKVGTTTFNSSITQLSNNIELKVSKNDVIAQINLTSEMATINASKISLAGKSINLTSDDITISSTNFSVSKDGIVTANKFVGTEVDITGKITATSGSFTGSITANSGSIGGWRITDTLLGTTGAVEYTVFMSRTGVNAYINGFGISPSCCFYSKGNFAVTTDGKLYATNADIQGKITSSSATITGGSLKVGSRFNVDTSGNLTASNADITGKITATSGSFTGRIYASSGTIAGWSLSSNGFSSTAANVASYIYKNGNVIFGGNYGQIKFDTDPVRITTANKLLLSDQYTCSTMASTNDSISIRGFNGTIHINSNFGVYANNTLLASSSSKKTKKNIKILKKKEINEIYDIVKSLQSYKYDYKKKYSGGQKNNYGFIIEDFEDTILNKILHVEKSKEDKNVKYYSHDDLTRLNTIVIQELQNKIERLEEKLYGQAD